MAKPVKTKWQDIYDVVGIKPGIIVTQKGEINLSDENIQLETIEKLHKEGCPYIKLKQAETEKTEN